jgi:hypothetical protein
MTNDFAFCFASAFQVSCKPQYTQNVCTNITMHLYQCVYKHTCNHALISYRKCTVMFAALPLSQLCGFSLMPSNIPFTKRPLPTSFTVLQFAIKATRQSPEAIGQSRNGDFGDHATESTVRPMSTPSALVQEHPHEHYPKRQSHLHCRRNT